MKKIKLFIVSILIILNSATLVADDFNDWKVKFKKRVISFDFSLEPVLF